MVEQHPHVGTQTMTDMQPCSKVLMQRRLFSHGETSLLCTLEPHPLKLQVHTCKLCQRNYAHILHVIWHLAFAACAGHALWSAWLHNARQCNATSQLAVFTNATEHTWPHPTSQLGVVSGATDLNLSTHRGQCNNFDSTQTHMWSCFLTMKEASLQHKTVPEVNNSPTCWYI